MPVVLFDRAFFVLFRRGGERVSLATLLRRAGITWRAACWQSAALGVTFNISFYFYMMALGLATDPSTVVVTWNAGAVIMYVLSIVVLKSKISILALVGITICVAGVAFVAKANANDAHAHAHTASGNATALGVAPSTAVHVLQSVFNVRALHAETTNGSGGVASPPPYAASRQSSAEKNLVAEAFSIVSTLFYSIFLVFYRKSLERPVRRAVDAVDDAAAAAASGVAASAAVVNRTDIEEIQFKENESKPLIEKEEEKEKETGNYLLNDCIYIYIFLFLFF